MIFRIYKTLYPYFRPYRKAFWAALILLVLMNGIAYLIPWEAGYIWDHIFPRVREPGGLALLAQYCGFLVLLALIRGILVFFMISAFWGSATKVVKDLRNQLYDKLQRLSFRFYDTARTGDLMSRLTLDLEMIRNFYAFNVEHRVQIWLYFSVISVLLFLTDWKLALVCLAVIPFLIWAILKFSRKMRAAVDSRQKQAGLLNAMVQENITGIRVVKAFAMEDAEMRRFDAENQRMLDCNLAVSQLQVKLHPLLALCSAIAMVMIIGYGGFRVATGVLSLGKFITFVSYVAMLNWPVTILAPNTNQLNQVRGSMKRILEILNQPEEISSPKDGLVLSPFRGRIEFEDVAFSYGEQPVLKGIHLVVEAGEKVAVIGLTGSGKSTLINLIPRFYDPDHGRITIDGVDLRRLSLGWWRRQVGLVLQETFLFSATIFDNIAFGHPEATPAEVEAAAKAAQIDGFIESLPDGYQTVIGERGVGLSGGQKQRIAIARALLLNPRVLILDDSTSSVDMETERAIQQSLRKIMAGRTTILITQRFSTAKLADRIIVLESGSIRSQGSHEELLDQDDFYRQLYKYQMMELEQPEESA
ncbi:MAG: ABC transporter ATP-binding protein/permease [Firmicutes bacterium]|nr:ABC transporter ATP-binding protein/permease [Bacillota bacterium]